MTLIIKIRHFYFFMKFIDVLNIIGIFIPKRIYIWFIQIFFIIIYIFIYGFLITIFNFWIKAIIIIFFSKWVIYFIAFFHIKLFIYSTIFIIYTFWLFLFFGIHGIIIIPIYDFINITHFIRTIRFYGAIHCNIMNIFICKAWFLRISIFIFIFITI